MKPPTALLADDEDLPRADLRRQLAAAWPELEILAEADHGPAAIEALAALQPDVAFLDIRMPGRSGLEVAHAASGRCHVVFTTAYEAHAVEAFAAGAVDYLLKPVQPERLAHTVQRLRERLAARHAPAELVPSAAAVAAWPAAARPRAAEPLRWISAGVGDVIKLFAIDEVLFFQSDEKYTRVVSASDEAHVRKPLREIVEALDDTVFWQVHRGTVVRAAEIARAVRGDEGRITLHLRHHPERLAVSQAWAWRFRPM